jgi:hypothetical protein
MRYLFLILGFLFVGVWLAAWLAFHIASGAVHLLLVIGLIGLVLHFVRGRSSV